MSSAAEVGFARPEMFSKSLAGTWKERTDKCIFLILGKADEWPSDIKDLPQDSLLHVLQNALKGATLKCKTKVLLAEAAEDDTEGDVLIFPGPTRFNIKSGTDALVKALQEEKEAADLEECHVFICAHKNRDARCGHCGPELVEAIVAAPDGKAARVRKCSHVGGHEFAGNALVFQKAAGDFYGYVTPDAVDDLLSGNARRSRLWRGALGLSKEGATLARAEELRKARRQQLAHIMNIAMLAGIGLACAWLVRRLANRRQ